MARISPLNPEKRLCSAKPKGERRGRRERGALPSRHMGGLRKKNRLSGRSFLVYFVCIAIPVLLLTTSYTYRQFEQAQNEYNDTKARAMDHAAQMVASQFDALEQTANEIYLSSWYKKSISQAAVYQDEFNIVRQLEISSDLMYKASQLPFAEDILILNAEEDTIICKYGWFHSIEKYMDANCALDLSGMLENLRSTDLFAPVMSLNEQYWVLSYPDPNCSSNQRLAILINDAEVRGYLETLGYGGFTSISLFPSVDGSSAAENIRLLKRPELTLAFSYPDFQTACHEENVSRIVVCLFLSLAASGALAVLFTFLFARPLDKLVQSFSHVPSKNQHDAIESLSMHILEITEQNEALQREMACFANDMRAEILLRIMTGTDVSGQDADYARRLFPQLAAGRPYFLLINQREEKFEALEKEFFCLPLKMPMDYCGCLIWGEGCDSARALRNRLCEQARLSACSDIYEGIEALPACYQDAVKQLDTLPQGIPLGDLLALFTQLQSGNKEKCMQLLAPYLQSGSTRNATLILRLLSRWMEENQLSHITLPELSRDVAEYDTVERLVSAICDHTVPETRRSCPALIASVNRFMNEYYALPDLSLKYLAGQFDTSVSTLSRLYKQETGRNFSTVLLEIRMERAKEQLVHTNQSISGIALSCGYENYLSFKRAFLRSEGITPREYREANAVPDEQNETALPSEP